MSSTLGRGKFVGPVTYALEPEFGSGGAPHMMAPGPEPADPVDPWSKVQLGGALADAKPYSFPDKCYEFKGWRRWSETKRVAKIREITLEYGSDPRVRHAAVTILKSARVPPRGYKNWAAQKALLKWVQKNIYYVNEPGEVLQTPAVTLQLRYADCDDMAILLGSLFHSVRLPFRFVLSGTLKGGHTVRWVEGHGRPPKGVTWSHIYLCVGNQPFNPTSWKYAEPTLRKAELGWDVVQAGGQILPEMAGPGLSGVGDKESAKIVAAVPNIMVHRDATLWEKFTKDIDHGLIGKAIVVGGLTALVGVIVRGAAGEGKKKR